MEFKFTIIQPLWTTSAESSNWGGYIGIFFMFVVIIGFGVGAVYYAKWLKYGPKWKRFVSNTKKRFTGKLDKSGPKVQKGAVITNISTTEKLDANIETAKTPQELLEAQNAKISHDRQVKVLEQKLVTEAELAKEKQEDKAAALAEKQRYKDEVKTEKEAKKAEKSEKKAEKKKE